MGRGWLGCGLQLNSPGTEPSWRGGSAWGAHPAPWWSSYSSGPGFFHQQQQQQQPVPSSTGSVSVQPRLCGHGGSLGGPASLSPPGQLGLLTVQSPQATLEWELGVAQPWERQHSGSPIPRDISAGQGLEVASAAECAQHLPGCPRGMGMYNHIDTHWTHAHF